MAWIGAILSSWSRGFSELVCWMGKPFAQGIEDRQQAEMERAAALQRQQISSGPGYMNAALARDRFNL